MAGGRRDASDSGDGTSELWRLSGMGMEFVASVAGMALLGWLIDRWAGTMPRWTIVGLVLGLVGGGYNFMWQAIRAGRAAESQYRRTHPKDVAGSAPSEAARTEDPREADDD